MRESVTRTCRGPGRDELIAVTPAAVCQVPPDSAATGLQRVSYSPLLVTVRSWTGSRAGGGGDHSAFLRPEAGPALGEAARPLCLPLASAPVLVPLGSPLPGGALPSGVPRCPHVPLCDSGTALRSI